MCRNALYWVKVIFTGRCIFSLLNNFCILDILAQKWHRTSFKCPALTLTINYEKNHHGSQKVSCTWKAFSSCCLVASSSCLMAVMSWRSLEFSACDSSHSFRMLSNIFGGCQQKLISLEPHQRQGANMMTERPIFHGLWLLICQYRVDRGDVWRWRGRLCLHLWRGRGLRAQALLLGCQGLGLGLVLDGCWRLLIN